MPHGGNNELAEKMNVSLTAVSAAFFHLSRTAFSVLWNGDLRVI